MVGLTRFLTGPYERKRLGVSLVASEGALSERLPPPEIAGKLVVDPGGALLLALRGGGSPSGRPGSPGSPERRNRWSCSPRRAAPSFAGPTDG